MSTVYMRNPETNEFELVGAGNAATDTTLSQSGKPADAAAVGSALTNYATAADVSAQVNTKVDKVDGKGLSTNDYTTAEKTKLAGIETGANKTTLSSLGITATATELNYVDGVTSNIQTQLNSKIANNVFNGAGTAGTAGYVAFAKLVITGSYTNRPIEFELIGRGRNTPCYLSVRFGNTSSNDPDLANITYTGSDYGVFAHKTATSTWLLYAKKSEAYDTITVARMQAATQSITITHPGSFITEKPTVNVYDAGCIVADYVIAEGSGANGYYRQWNSGKLEQWMKVSTTSQAINTAYESIYIGTYRWYFPLEFYSTDCVQCSYFRWGTSASWGGVVGATATYADLRGYDFYSRATGTTCVIHAYAIGRWK